MICVSTEKDSRGVSLRFLLSQPRRRLFFALSILVAVVSKGLWVGCPIVRASDEHCFIVRVLRAQRLYFLPPIFLFLFNLARRDLKGGADF
jgi:hypothetical protein